jgi:hypothetical protein
MGVCGDWLGQCVDTRRLEMETSIQRYGQVGQGVVVGCGGRRCEPLGQALSVCPGKLDLAIALS